MKCSAGIHRDHFGEWTICERPALYHVVETEPGSERVPVDLDVAACSLEHLGVVLRRYRQWLAVP